MTNIIITSPESLCTTKTQKQCPVSFIAFYRSWMSKRHRLTYDAPAYRCSLIRNQSIHKRLFQTFRPSASWQRTDNREVMICLGCIICWVEVFINMSIPIKEEATNINTSLKRRKWVMKFTSVQPIDVFVHEISTVCVSACRDWKTRIDRSNFVFWFALS